MTKLNKELCRQSYLDVVEYSARLAAFATSSFSDIIGHGHYESRAAELAVRDIIFLSISLRRLVELTKQYGIIKSKEIACFTAHRVDGVLMFKESDHKFNAWEIVGNVIHAKNIFILKDDVSFSSFFGKRETNAFELYNKYSKRHSIHGVVIIQSDRGDIKHFEIYRLIKAIVDFTDEIDDHLADNEIYVGLGFE